MYNFAHEGHEHAEDMAAHASSDDPLAIVVLVVLVVGAVIALAAVIRHRKK